jgi:hypothetical protein
MASRPEERRRRPDRAAFTARYKGRTGLGRLRSTRRPLHRAFTVDYSHAPRDCSSRVTLWLAEIR